MQGRIVGVFTSYGVLETLLMGFFVLLCIWYARFRHSRRRMYLLADRLPKIPRMLPFIGNAHQFSGNSEDLLINMLWINEFVNKNKGVISTWIGPLLYISISDPESIEIILNSCLKKDKAYRFLKPWLGDGLISGSLPTWKRHRKTLMPAFNQKILDSFIDVFNEQSDLLVKKLKREVNYGLFDVFKYLSPCTLDIICETAMGVKVNAQENDDLPYIKASMSQTDIIYQRMFKIWLHPNLLFKMTQLYKTQEENLKVLKEFTSKVIQRKKTDYAARKLLASENNHNEDITDFTDCKPIVKRKAFLDLMIELSENGGNWSDEELREEVDTMTTAGNDTSAQLSSYTLVMLGAHPEVQEKVMKELNNIFGGSTRPVTKDDLPKMEYLERVLKETLRLFPIVPIISREVHEEIQVGKYILPAGCDCIIGVIGLHRRKDIWGLDVEEFNPDRFLPENQANRHPYAYIPFSAGPRNCIGKQFAMMSVKVLVSTILRSYRISADSDIKAIALKAEIVLRPINGHMISLEPRN